MRDAVGSWLFSDLAEGGLPSRGLLPLENPDLHDHESTCRLLREPRSYRTVTVGEHRGVPAAVFRAKFGAPAAALLVDAAGDHGLKSLVAVGFCGGLVEGYRTGDIIAVSRCHGDDGTSRAYGVATPPVPDEGMHRVLRKALDAGDVTWHEGPAWSTDAVLLEDDDRIRAWRGEGAVAVDMESRAVLTAAARSGVAACVLLVVSDNPAAGTLADASRLSRGWDRAVSAAYRVMSTAPPEQA